MLKTLNETLLEEENRRLKSELRYYKSLAVDNPYGKVGFWNGEDLPVEALHPPLPSTLNLAASVSGERLRDNNAIHILGRTHTGDEQFQIGYYVSDLDIMDDRTSLQALHLTFRNFEEELLRVYAKRFRDQQNVGSSQS